MTPFPRTCWLWQIRSSCPTESTSSSSISRLSTSGRICNSANSLGFPGGTFMLTANSISTCVPIPHVPMSRISSRISASGKIRCFRIGANVTTLFPSRETPSYTESFSGEYVEPT